MSPSDYRVQKLSRNEARKQISEMMKQHPENVRFSRHAIIELQKDNLTTTDVLNVLKSPDSKIYKEGEWENGSYRYRLETSYLSIVIGFWVDGSGFNIVTAWDKRKGGILK